VFLKISVDSKIALTAKGQWLEEQMYLEKWSIRIPSRNVITDLFQEMRGDI
jgi:hypothetical protein